MASEDDETSPFTRPGFVASAVVVFLLVVGGVGVAVFGGDKDEPPAQPEPTATPAPDPPAETAQDSVCGLKGEVLEESRLSSAPEAEWDYQRTFAYPTSNEYGPGATSDEGYRYCFQHSPEGALFAAANAVAQGSHDREVGKEWIEYALANGPYRDELLGEAKSGGGGDAARGAIKGFRLLNYDGQTASVDVAMRMTAEGQTLTFSAVYDLVWQNGDWKLAAETKNPIDFAQIPDLSGYISWGA